MDLYKKQLERIDEELITLPQGHLGRKKNYYQHIIKGEKTGITRNKELIRQLARKAYLLTSKAQLENNISNPLSEFNFSTARELISLLPYAYKDLPESYFYHPSIEGWLAANYKKNTINQEQAEYNSSNDIEFRSLAERTIAEILAEYGLPYFYDVVIRIGGREVSPDFIIKNPFTGETYIWEHFGAFNQEGYEASMNNKMNRYMNNGLIPNENLISTYKYHIQNTQRIRDLIEQIIL